MMMPEKEEILTVNAVNVFYKDSRKGILKKNNQVHILKDISFSMKEGEILGLVGESGSGKSTLAKAILGLIPYEGEIKQSSSFPQMVFQDPYGSLNPAKKIGWSLEEPLKLRGGMDAPQRKQRVQQMLEMVGLDEKFAERYPNQLSGGQRQRICIAVALMQEPKLLIADEPVSALDVTIQAQILELFEKIHREMGLSILFISHDLRVVYQMCDRVMIMKDGQIVESGLVEEVYFHHQSNYTERLLKAAGIETN
ncbi:MAG: dipeptide/oligopeptide/nickel ABC transporter ATP-binding protein [Firmicutes bacterium]|nr:dipeptide/oligopeptide/nickel ABC transporter ATP-binding protein [Bacillota bacterium]